jgi:hypothetical protein
LSDSNVECLFNLCGCWEKKSQVKLYLRDNLKDYQTIFVDKKDINNPPPYIFRA